MNKLLFISAVAVIIASTSCRKVYHNCECAYLNEYDEVDTLLISVRARNKTKAAEECGKSEIRIAKDEGFFVYCSLQY